ncbi:MAG: peroxiredoxin family protein [Pyrinomonadaceae bacterium]
MLSRLNFCRLSRPVAAAVLLLAAAQLSLSQAPTPRHPKTIYLDSNGRPISNNEFVDLRLANPADKTDPATKRITDDGDTEFVIKAPRQEGTRAPEFEVPTIDGKLYRSSDLKGKVVVLNFWFIGCPNCLGELVNLNSLRSKFKDERDVVFIAVAPDTPAEIRSFIKQNPFSYELVGSARSIVDLFNFRGFPRNIVIGRDGRIAYWRSVVYAWDKFESVIREELDKKY